MDKGKPTICQEYLRPDSQRCDFIKHLEKLIAKGDKESEEIRERFHKQFCGYTNYTQCPEYKLIKETKNDM